MAGIMTRFCPGTELFSGDVVVDEDGDEHVVAIQVLEGGRNHVSFEDGYEDVVLTEDDIVEVRCGPGMEEYDHE